ncbi:hypothetical protein SAMN02990966_03924 [Rhodospirillales bacterium URHD0017]|nr:hypothetical protein SAMN02990966_03924 [Rhodospirillales bacterium URHD0017]
MRGLGYRLTDMLVIAACSLTFIAVVSSARHEPRDPPIGLIAQDLGTTPEHFQEVAEKIVPHRPSGPPPTEAQKKELAAALYVSVEQLDTVMEKYRPLRLHHR